MPDVLVLANSYKGGGGRRCVAGIDVSSGLWVRPVGDTGDGELTPFQTRAEGEERAREVQPLDLVSMELGTPLPSPYHPEDIRRGNDNWRGIKRLTVRSLLHDFATLRSPGPELLGSVAERLSLPEIRAFGGAHQSLTLVRPDKVSFGVQTNTFNDRRQLRAQFVLARQLYDLSVTDVRYSADHVPPKGDYVLTVSLAVPWLPSWSDEPLCYKIVAGVMPVE